MAILLVALPMFSQIINVPTDQPSIQAGIDSASNGDTVLVAEDIYFENINFKGKAITVASRFILDGDTAHISKTIIDGSQAVNPNKASTVLMISGEDSTSVLMGLSVTGGKGTNFALIGVTHKGGGGILISGSGGKIIHNIIENNRMEMEGQPDFCFGAGLLACVSQNHNVVIRNNLIRNNYASANNVDGGGMALIGGRILCENNLISHNTAEATTWVLGGGIYYGYFGSAGVIEEVTIRNNTIYHNAALSSDGGGGGGFVQQNGFDNGQVKFYNNVVHHNHSFNAGGGILFVEASGSTFNNTIVDNTADITANNVAIAWNGDLKLYNNIIWSTGDGPVSEFLLWDIKAANFFAFHNLIMEPMGTDEQVSAFNNTFQAPIFQEGSYELAPKSPGIGQAIDTAEVDKAYYFAPTHDFKDNVRPNPVDAYVDMGAFESPYQQSVFIPDTVFLQALIERGVDTNEDSLISYEEAEAVTTLYVGGFFLSKRDITDMTGIEAFVNLGTLDCSSNYLTSLDVSSNTKLTVLHCALNLLTSLDVSANTALTELYCAENQLTSLDVSKNTNLEKFHISGNQLATLDISNNRNLFQRALPNGYSPLSVANMPSLTEICVWEGFNFNDYIPHIDTAGSPNICFQIDCNGDCIVGIVADIHKSGISIYPNPSYNFITIETGNPNHYSIQITSLNGQQILTGEMEGCSHHIDLSSFQKGIYFITIRSKDFVTTRKIIKL